MADFTVTIHGGAGTILQSSMTAEKEKAYRAALDDSADTAFHILGKGGSAMDAVRAAVRSLEDNILFNAGKGSVYAHDGSQEMDASIMDGHTMMAGAVSAVRNIKNPVELAFAVMQHSEHVMLNGKGAEAFAAKWGITREEDDYFHSDFRYQQLQMMKEEDGVSLDHNVAIEDKKFGTVGAAACDQYGNIAAATSTGGMTNKKWGRIGDSPIIGAGTYANNKTCAVSCTGHGEYFLRAVAAYDVSCLMEYRNLSLKEAMEIVVFDKLLKMGGEGGMVAVDNKGHAEMIFNSEGMYRALRSSTGRSETAIYK